MTREAFNWRCGCGFSRGADDRFLWSARVPTCLPTCGWEYGACYAHPHSTQATKGGGPRHVIQAMACATSLPAGVELVDLLLEVCHGARPSHLHGGGEFALFDREITRQ